MHFVMTTSFLPHFHENNKYIKGAKMEGWLKSTNFSKLNECKNFMVPPNITMLTI